MLAAHQISKSFGHTTALQNVSLTLRPNTVHGILGENGAGKSTLMNILFGLLPPDSGHISLNNQPLKRWSPRIAQRAGVGMVHQHFKLVPPLTVLENIALAAATSLGPLRRRALLDRITHLAHTLSWPINPHARVESLSVGQQQRVEIIKALAAGGTRVLILDEPTAVLTPQEAADLTTAVRKLANAGTAVLFISHKLNEIEALCDDVTVLRRGTVVFSAPMPGLTKETLAHHMVGNAPTLPATPSTPIQIAPDATPVLELRNLSSGRLRHASLQLRPGEILGIAGVDGNGQSDLVSATVGDRPITTGQLLLHDTPAAHTSIRHRADHIAFVPEDRHSEALVLGLPILHNLLLKRYREMPFSTFGLLRPQSWRQYANDLVRRFDVRCNSPLQPAGSLSGGNQQKVVLARELAPVHPEGKRLVVAVNPTRGLDIGATAFVMRELLNARDNGAGVLLIHADLDELLAVADRILVLYNGTLTPVPPNRHAIGRAMAGLPVGESHSDGDAAA